jgi:pimeloyl-ACP methyl ester carboxylesterase
VRDLMNAVDPGPNLVRISVGAAIAADLASICPYKIEKLVLVSPLGHFDVADPSADPWCVKPGRGQMELCCLDHDAWRAHQSPPEGADSLEWEIMQIRANEAAARLLWPTGDIGIIDRLRRILWKTLILRGDQDLVL